ncbi:winged helix-turn-helix domain-containing protein [Poseidonibacter lekithochrous]|uniref:winged helix-turn-helix domain-containing protein n=1 Tax=Poseidonibacter lekithochrous TaxID=1904463 RepID=UPI0008FC4F72|nr:helix-turn-helix domain-containing protein [Poseidonibacter lekithochrous]QKJ23367.1 signal transduction response regulator, OmpR family [Poseidonibacter lekithochrous]
MKELKHINLMYIYDSDNSEIMKSLENISTNIIKVESLEEANTLLKNKYIDIIISEKIILTEQLKYIREISPRTHIISFKNYIDNSSYFDAIKLEQIKYLNPTLINFTIFKEELKDIIKTLDSNRSNIIQLKDAFTYDKYNNTLLKNKKIISLSNKEDMFLDYIINNQDRAISYEELNSTLWEGDMTHNALRSVVKEVRKKTYKNLVKNISGVGYRIDL